MRRFGLHCGRFAMRLRLAFAVLVSFGVMGAATAAPQILALLSTEGPVPLACEGAVCTAELSAFCLEEQRATPETGTAYRAAATGGLVLIVTARDGSVTEIDAAPLAVFASLRDMTAVRVTIDRRALGDVARVALRVAESSTLLPAVAKHDGRPHTGTEIARATGPLRSAAALIVDRGADAAVARDLSRALNLLQQEDEPAAALLAGAAAPVVRGCTAKLAEDRARRQSIIGLHGYWTGRSIVGEPSLKACLEEAHGTLMTSLNRRFWKGEAPAPAAVTPPQRM
jgi:hypothetical protein